MLRSVDRLLAGTQLSLLEVRFLTYLKGAWAGQGSGCVPPPPGRLGCEPTSGILPKALVTLLDHLHHVPASHSKRLWASLLVAHHHRVPSWNLVAGDAAYQTQLGLPPQAPSEATAAVRLSAASHRRRTTSASSGPCCLWGF